jgi:hypothetical protein
MRQRVTSATRDRCLKALKIQGKQPISIARRLSVWKVDVGDFEAEGMPVAQSATIRPSAILA